MLPSSEHTRELSNHVHVSAVHAALLKYLPRINWPFQALLSFVLFTYLAILHFNLVCNQAQWSCEHNPPALLRK